MKTFAMYEALPGLLVIAVAIGTYVGGGMRMGKIIKGGFAKIPGAMEPIPCAVRSTVHRAECAGDMKAFMSKLCGLSLEEA
jgi:hypothetical protein